MKAVIRRLRILEVSAGLVETAESRLAREESEILLRRIAEGRARWAAASARLRLSPDVSDGDRVDLSGLTVVEILNRGASVRGSATSRRSRRRWLTSRYGPENTGVTSTRLSQPLKRLETRIMPIPSPIVMTVQFVGPNKEITGPA
jgi:hypothetical protein